MGLVDKLRSPMSTDRNGAAASVPASKRIDVPEFPQSSGARASVSADLPSPSTSSVVKAFSEGSSFHVEP
jgi:hypothetical protein